MLAIEEASLPDGFSYVRTTTLTLDGPPTGSFVAYHSSQGEAFSLGIAITPSPAAARAAYDDFVLFMGTLRTAPASATPGEDRQRQLLYKPTTLTVDGVTAAAFRWAGGASALPSASAMPDVVVAFTRDRVWGRVDIDFTESSPLAEAAMEYARKAILAAIRAVES